VGRAQLTRVSDSAGGGENVASADGGDSGAGGRGAVCTAMEAMGVMVTVGSHDEAGWYCSGNAGAGGGGAIGGGWGGCGARGQV